MNKQKGFTILELMIVMAIIGILAAIAIPAWKNRNATPEESITRTRYGAVATACVNGFSYTVDANGYANQQFNAQGGGVPCRK